LHLFFDVTEETKHYSRQQIIADSAMDSISLGLHPFHCTPLCLISKVLDFSIKSFRKILSEYSESKNDLDINFAESNW
jgi:hypothetical protein